MLRRVARVLRYLLLIAGSIVLVWIPVSYIVYSECELSSEHRSGWIRVHNATLMIEILRRPYAWDDQVSLNVYRPYQVQLATFWAPSAVNLRYGWHVVIPLWLLAFLCLAWPVTSFLLARRRRGRGFPVESHPRSEVIDSV